MQFQTLVINNPLSLFSLLLSFSLFSIPDNGWRGQTMYSCHLTPPPSLDSTSTNICCVQSCFGQGGEGVDAEVKPISMQIVMTSCVHPPPLPVFFFFSLLVELPGGCWEGCLSSDWVSVTDKLLSSQIPTIIITVDEPENNMCTGEHSHTIHTYTHQVYIQMHGYMHDWLLRCTSLFIDSSLQQTSAPYGQDWWSRQAIKATWINYWYQPDWVSSASKTSWDCHRMFATKSLQDPSGTFPNTWLEGPIYTCHFLSASHIWMNKCRNHWSHFSFLL